MTLERVRELMAIERECVKQANTCGRNCAKCDLVQEDKDLLKAYEIVQYALVVLEHFNDAMDDLEALAKNREKELYKELDELAAKEEEKCMAEKKS